MSVAIASLQSDDVIRTILRGRVDLLGYINSFLREPHLSEDCFQDICAAAVSPSGPIFEDEKHVIRWAMRVARNKAIDQLRRAETRPKVLDVGVLEVIESKWTREVQSSDDAAIARTEALSQCIKTLTPNNQKLIAMRYNDRMPSGQIATKLGRTKAAIYKSITRIHATLRKCIEQRLSATGPLS